MFIEKYPRISLGKSKLKNKEEENKTNYIFINKDKNSIIKSKNKNFINKNGINKLSERKFHNNIIEKIDICKKMKPKKINQDKKNINLKKPSVNIKKNISHYQKKLISKNKGEIHLHEYKSKNTGIKIDNVLINKYVQKGKFSIKYNSKMLKKKDTSFEIFPESLNEENLSPIKPVHHFNISENILDEIKKPIINDKKQLLYDNIKNQFSKSNIRLSMRMNPIKPNNIKNFKNTKEIFNNEKILENNSEIDDPFLYSSPKFNVSDDIWKDLGHISCKEKKELSFTEEDDEILI